MPPADLRQVRGCDSLRDTDNVDSATSRGHSGAITIPIGFFECLGMLIIPRNSLKFVEEHDADGVMETEFYLPETLVSRFWLAW